MNKLYSELKDLEEDLKKNGEILLDFSDEELKNKDVPVNSWMCCGSTSKGNKVLGMKIEFYDTFQFTAQSDTMIRYIIVS